MVGVVGGEGGDPLSCGICQGKLTDRPLGTTTARLILKEAVAAAQAATGGCRRVQRAFVAGGRGAGLAVFGFNTAAIMRAGGWKSVNVLGRYLEFAGHNVWV